MSKSSTVCAPTPSPTALSIGWAPRARGRPCYKGWPYAVRCWGPHDSELSSAIPDAFCLPHCHRLGQRLAEPTCQSIDGAAIDAAVGELLVATVTPLAIEVALAVQQEIQAQLEETDRLRRLQVERAQYEAELARQRYLLVDPANRLLPIPSKPTGTTNSARAPMPRTIDRQRRRWRGSGRDLSAGDPPARHRLSGGLAGPAHAARERKRMAALLLEDVTVRRGDQVILHVRFRGGTATTLTVPRPLRRGNGAGPRPPYSPRSTPCCRAHRCRGRGAPQRAGAHHGGRSAASLAIASKLRAALRALPSLATACGRRTYSPPRNSPRRSASAMTR